MSAVGRGVGVGDAERRRRNVAVLELLERSYHAYAAGDQAGAHTLMDQATDLDVELVAAVTGAMRIGEVPQPGHEDWGTYLDGQRAHAALTGGDR